jgi:hypothetical protein
MHLHKIETLHPPPYNTQSVNARALKKRFEHEADFYKKVHDAEKIQASKLRHWKDIWLIDQYDNLNQHIKYINNAKSAYVGKTIDAFV